MSWLKSLKDFIRRFFSIEQEIHSNFPNSVNQSTNFDNYLLSEAYAIGNTNIISQVNKRVKGSNKNSFWSAPTDDFLCKRHSGLPKVILTAITNIVTENYDGLIFNEDKKTEKEIWEEIEIDNKFNEIVVKAVREALIFGEGAFKFTYDPEITRYPIIEFIPAKNCSIVYKYGRLQEIVFMNNVYTAKNGKTYILEEHYYKGGISYDLIDGQEKKVNLDIIDETASLEDVEFSNSDFIAAVPFKIFNSDRFEGHGEGIFDSKFDIIDALDETLTQYANTVRLSSPKLYADESCFKFDPETGNRDVKSTIFNQIYSLGGGTNPLNENKELIKLIQSALNSDEYGKTVSDLLTLLCAGLISTSTINIQLTKNSLISNESGQAQREREKQTLYTINKIKDSLNSTLPDVVYVAVSLYGYIVNKDYKASKTGVSVAFDEYANPSLESKLQALQAAMPGLSLMGPEEAIQLLYGYTLSEEKKAELIEHYYIRNYGVRNIDELYESKKNERITLNAEKSEQANNEFNIKEEILAE